MHALGACILAPFLPRSSRNLTMPFPLRARLGLVYFSWPMTLMTHGPRIVFVLLFIRKLSVRCESSWLYNNAPEVVREQLQRTGWFYYEGSRSLNFFLNEAKITTILPYRCSVGRKGYNERFQPERNKL